MKTKEEPVFTSTGEAWILDGTGNVYEDEALPKMNIALMERAIRWARAGGDDQYAWNQNWWTKWWMSTPKGYWNEYEERHTANSQEENFCGTSFCMAGYALFQTGNLVRSTDHLGEYRPVSEIQGYNGETVVVSSDESLIDWSSAGAAVLGLTEDEAREFFDGDNTLHRLENLAQDFADARGEHIDLGPA